MKTPYQEAVELIDQHPGTGSSIGLAKLILSLWNEACAYAFSECVRSLDEKRSDLAGRIILHYLAHGEDADLRRAGEHVCKTYPALWEFGLGVSHRQWLTDAERAKGHTPEARRDA